MHSLLPTVHTAFFRLFLFILTTTVLCLLLMKLKIDIVSTGAADASSRIISSHASTVGMLQMMLGTGETANGGTATTAVVHDRVATRGGLAHGKQTSGTLSGHATRTRRVLFDEGATHGGALHAFAELLHGFIDIGTTATGCTGRGATRSVGTGRCCRHGLTVVEGRLEGS